MKLKKWNVLYIGDFYKFKEGYNNLIIIDVTKEPFVKQLGILTNDKEIKIADANMLKRHLAHHRCKTPITIKGNSLYCDKCGYIIPIKDTLRWSHLKNKFLKSEDVNIGEALIDNKENPIVLIDLEYNRRREKISKMNFSSSNKQDKI